MLGAGAVLGAQALLVALAVQSRPAPPGSTDPSRGDSLGPDLDANPPEEWTREDDAQHHRGWLVLVWASAAPVPPEKPERGERAFATLANGALRLARDRKSPAVSVVDLEGCEVRLCGVPGAAADEPEQSWPANVRWRPKKDGAGKEKRWWKRLPIVVSHPERALYKGHRVLLCYALSDAAKEAWTVALHRDVHRSRAMVDRATFSAAAAAAPERRGVPAAAAAAAAGRDDETAALLDHLASMRSARESRDASRARDDAAHGSEATAETGWTSGGAAGAAVNAILSRILFDVQRSPDKVAELKYQLGNLCRGIPDLPKFVGPIRVEKLFLGRCVPQVLAARLPAASAGGGAAAPWDGGVLANRGPCSAAELEIEFGGVAEITLVTHIDLSVYAEMAGAEETGTGAGAREEAGAGAGAGTGTGAGAGEETSAVEENLRRIRDLATKNASKLIGAVAKKLVGVPISVTIRVKRLAGTLRVWIPPPPGDRLWFGFVDEPEVEMDATPSVGQLGIKWHGLAEKVSKMITAELLKEVHAALVLPNAGNAFLEPLQPFDDVPEIEVADLVELGKTSYVGEKTASRVEDAVAAAATTKKTTTTDSTSVSDSTSASSPEPAVRGLGSATAAEAAADDAAGRIFHTPSNSMLVEDAVAAAIADPSLDPGEMPPSPTLESKEEEEEAEEAVAAMVDSFLSAGSDGRDEDRRRDGDNSDGIGSPGGIGDWTSSASPPARGHVEVASPPRRRDDDSPLLDFHFGKPLARRPSLEGKPAGLNDAAASPGGASGSPRAGAGSGAGGAAGLRLFGEGGVFARRAMEAKDTLARAQATMRSDMEHIREGLKEGGVKGGLDVFKSVAARAAKEMSAEIRGANGFASPTSPAAEPKVYGGGQEIPFALETDDPKGEE
jgi:hypothetical protein